MWQKKKFSLQSCTFHNLNIKVEFLSNLQGKLTSTWNNTGVCPKQKQFDGVHLAFINLVILFHPMIKIILFHGINNLSKII